MPDYPTALSFSVRAGGAGKTQNVVNLGVALARRGYRVRVWDTDPQRNLSLILGYQFPPKGQPSLFDVLTGDVGITDAIVPARYRIGEGEDDSAFETIPNLSLVLGTPKMGNAEVTLAHDPAGVMWLANVRSTLPDDSADVDLVDCGPTIGVLQASIMVAFPDFVGCLYDEFKYIFGLRDLEDDLDTARRKLRLVGCTAQLRHILAVGIPIARDGSVNRRRGAITDDAIRYVRSDPDWGPILLPLVRQDIRVKDVVANQRALRFHAPMSPVLDDYELVADALGFPRRRP
jgi:chromosome partitioning protein